MTEAGEARLVDQGAERDGAHLCEADDGEPDQRPQSLRHELGAVVDRHLPGVVVGQLQPDERLHRPPEGGAESDEQRQPAAGDGAARDLVTDERHRLDRRPDQVVAQVGLVLEHEPDDRARGEEQREQRQEPVVREERSVATGLVPSHPVQRLDGDVDDAAAAPEFDDLRMVGERHQSVQSIGAWPCATSASLARLNGRLPKNPLWADSGDGCGDSMMVCRSRSINDFFFLA